MRAYQDSETGLWKWGANGKPIYQTKKECHNAGLNILTDRLRAIRKKLNDHLQVHGK